LNNVNIDIVLKFSLESENVKKLLRQSYHLLLMNVCFLEGLWNILVWNKERTFC